MGQAMSNERGGGVHCQALSIRACRAGASYDPWHNSPRSLVVKAVGLWGRDPPQQTRVQIPSGALLTF